MRTTFGGPGTVCRALLLAIGAAVVMPAVAAGAKAAVVAVAAVAVAVDDVPLATLSAELAAGRVTSVALVDAYLARIAALDAAGPRVNSVLALNPDARRQALALDAERRAGHVRGPLHGIPILVKDNVETADPLPTTAGSLALADNRTGRDAPLVARLRAAGAIVLGKTNLSEWANLRDSHSTSGWSAVGGLTNNPYALDRYACGSSSGSGAAVAASFAAAAIGTETDGSITCPASVTGIVGVKPTVGLVSRTHVVPISATQDTAGPMARTVRDAALLLSALAGSDPADPATAEADARRVDYAAALAPDALRGVRVGVLRDANPLPPRLAAVFERALATLRAAGAELVDIAPAEQPVLPDEQELLVLLTEFKAGLNDYLASTPASVTTRTLADLIAFNRAHADRELRWFGHDLFERAQATAGLADPAYVAARDAGRAAAGPDGIDRLLRAHSLALLVAPTAGPANLSDLVNGDAGGGPSATQLPAVAGYPHVTVPMGEVSGLPVGLSFVGSAWSEASLLAAAYAFEQRANARVAPRFLPTVDLRR